jgi:hypothetical protein
LANAPAELGSLLDALLPPDDAQVRAVRQGSFTYPSPAGITPYRPADLELAEGVCSEGGYPVPNGWQTIGQTLESAEVIGHPYIRLRK